MKWRQYKKLNLKFSIPKCYNIQINTIHQSITQHLTSRSLSLWFQEHIRYIRHNNPQSAYALHILQNQHEYGPLNSAMTLLKPLNNPNLLLPYDQYYIQTLRHEGKLIPEQNPGETYPLFQTAIKPAFHTNKTVMPQPAYHMTPAAPHRNANTHRTRYVVTHSYIRILSKHSTH